MTAIKPARHSAARSTTLARPKRAVASRKAARPAAARKSVPAVKALRPARIPLKPLASGQVWLVGDAHLKVEMIGKLLVHYKLAKPTAVRTPTSIAGITTLVKFMKKSKAVLIQG
jgi:hypothetical protein